MIDIIIDKTFIFESNEYETESKIRLYQLPNKEYEIQRLKEGVITQSMIISESLLKPISKYIVNKCL